MKYIFSLLVIIVCIATFFLVIKPRYDNLKDTRDQVSSYNSSLSTAEQLRVSRDELVAKYNNIPKADLDSLKTLLPDSVDNIRLIIQLDSIATKNNMSTLRNVEYSSESDTAVNSDNTSTIGSNLPYGEFTASFQTSGTYQNFLAFLSDLEQNLRIVDITSVDFGGSEGSSGGDGQPMGNNLTYKINLKTYWLKK